MERKRIVSVVGTRPEAIKMAPVIAALKAEPWVDCRVVVTAQHRELLDDAFETFGIVPDVDLNLMQPNQSLAQITGRAFQGLEEVLKDEAPDMVLSQGDTTTVMVTAMTSFYLNIPFGHIEAGLRTGDMKNPFPEEANRVIASKVSSLHFAPTAQSANALKSEGIDPSMIVTTGNTVIDALMATRAKNPVLDIDLPEGARLILMTAHRRENFGEPLERAFAAIKKIIDAREDVHLLYPVHPNPNVKALAETVFAGMERVHLRAPMTYEPFIAAMSAADIIVTDSGGVQEEAPAIGKPVLVMREETERPEATQSGVVRLVGTDPVLLTDMLNKLLDDKEAYAAMAKGVSPYGDGKASRRIVQSIAQWFDQKTTFEVEQEFEYVI